MKCGPPASVFCSRLYVICLPSSALAPLMDKGLRAEGVIFISDLINDPAGPIRRAVFGCRSTGERTFPVRVSSIIALSGSSVYTVARSRIVFPASPSVLTLNVISPVPPGGICLECETARQPHPAWTPAMFNGASPSLAMLK